jgi:hypothetical protein
MSPLRAHVVKDRRVLEEPTALSEGTVVDLVADDEGDHLTEEERRALHEALSESWNSAEAGRPRPVSVILDELRLTLVSPPVRTTLEADAQIGEIDDWCRENRLCSPEFFFEEHVLELVLGRGVL